MRRVDRYVATQPRSLRAQIVGALLLVEQSPAVVLGRSSRFSGLSRAERVRVLDALLGRRDVVAEAARAVRDLVMLGHYQRPEAWARLAYAGPWVTRDARPDPYAAFVARGAPAGFEASP